MRVALVHYWLVNMRGGERVLESLCRLFPEADIYTHVLIPESLSPTLRRHRIRTTFINRLPGSARHYQKYLPLMPLALEQLDLRAYDLIVSSESGPAKGVLARADTPHLCYCHTPMRYLWDFYQDYLETAGPLTRVAMRVLFHRLRQWDALSAGRPHRIVANSHVVAQRVARWWGREASVVYPPVDTLRFAAAPDAGPPQPDAPYLYVGQLVRYKRPDIAVQACSRSGRRLLVAGDGEERRCLEGMAGPGVRFLGRVGHEELPALYRHCRALLFPGEEDFGIVPVEAQAAGRPVIAYGRGGAVETVRHGETGMFFDSQTAEALCAALDEFESMPPPDAARLAAHAAAFSEERFLNQMRGEIGALLEQVGGGGSFPGA